MSELLQHLPPPQRPEMHAELAEHVVPDAARHVPVASQCPDAQLEAQQTLPEQRPETHAALLLFAHVPPVATRHAPSLALHCFCVHGRVAS